MAPSVSIQSNFLAGRKSANDAANSAGFYWAMKEANRNADGAHVLERQTVTQYAATHATLSYYRSVSFWEACAKVNLPGAVNTPWSQSLNGFVDRCCAYVQVLMVVSEMQFPNASGPSLLPETMTPRKI